MKKNSIKLLIADDHELFRKGIISLLLGEERINIIGEANNGKDLIYKTLLLKPDLIITDIAMPELSGLEAVKLLRQQNQATKIIFLTMYSGEDYIYHCYKSGGDSLINKDISKTELLQTIELVCEGGKYFGSNYSGAKLDEFITNYEQEPANEITADLNEISPKEADILFLIAEGLTSNEIAERMYISKRTVDTHRIHLMQKLNLKSFPQLMKFAINFTTDNKRK
ncbi:MAG: response regulator transcription factor [Ignavibacteriales bacterium]|nr:MAG: response regulator transcription factor [Ignavibacteriales bacterium]